MYTPISLAYHYARFHAIKKENSRIVTSVSRTPEVAIRPDQNKRAGPNVIGAVRMTFRYQDASSAYVPRMRKRLKLAEFESSPLPDLRFVAISFLRGSPGHPIQSLAPADLHERSQRTLQAADWAAYTAALGSAADVYLLVV